MALITCTECKKEISDQATNCPQCGNPIKSNNTLSLPPKVELITNTANPPIIQLELTAKKWKRVILTAWGMLLVGLFITGLLSNLGDQKWIGISLAIVSVPVWIIGKVGAWYSNR